MGRGEVYFSRWSEASLLFPEVRGGRGEGRFSVGGRSRLYFFRTEKIRQRYLGEFTGKGVRLAEWSKASDLSFDITWVRILHLIKKKCNSTLGNLV